MYTVLMVFSLPETLDKTLVKNLVKDLAKNSRQKSGGDPSIIGGAGYPKYSRNQNTPETVTAR